MKLDIIKNLKDLSRYTGDYSQIFFAKEYRMHGGHGDGMRAIDIANGSGLECTILPDRALDIGRLSYNTINCSHISNVGYLRPEYFDRYGNGPLGTFTAGFLTTCGLKNVGPSLTDNDYVYPMHGGVSNEPAEEVCVRIDTESERPAIYVSGRVRQAVFLVENLWLNRIYTIPLFENRIVIHDVIENRGYKPEEIMILYHFNIGYPLLDANSVFITSNTFDHSRDDVLQSEIEERCAFTSPQDEYTEKLFYYRQKPVTGGKSFAGLTNPELNLAAVIWSLPNQLPWLSNWKNPKSGSYVMGIEPANCTVEGIVNQRGCGVEKLSAQEKKSIELEIELASGKRIEELTSLGDALNRTSERSER